jgi:UDPglucose 6-dehydrogenase
MRHKFAIIGGGYVGQAMSHFFMHGNDVITYDPPAGRFIQWKVGHPDTIRDEVLYPDQEGALAMVQAADLAVICVPTPQAEDGSCDTSIVEEVVGWLEVPLILIKSTVPPGTTDRLRKATGKRIVFSPEYTGESAYFTPPPYDFADSVAKEPWYTFGGEQADCDEIIDRFFMPIGGPCKTYHTVRAAEAEIAKYMENAFYAMKVAAVHEFKAICDAMGISWSRARETWLLDPRIGPMHTAAWTKDGPPFGGKCLPKDTAALVKFATDAGYFPGLFDEVLATNSRLTP